MNKLCRFLFMVVLAIPGVAAAKEPYKTHEIGGGLTITLPSGWQLKSFPMPIEGATNFRLETSDIRMAITGIPTDEEAMSTDELAKMLGDVSAPYLPKAKASGNAPVAFTTRLATGTYAELETASGDEEFMVFPGRAYACVIPAIVSAKNVIFSISVGCEDKDDKDYKEVLKALQTIGS